MPPGHRADQRQPPLPHARRQVADRAPRLHHDRRRAASSSPSSARPAAASRRRSTSITGLAEPERRRGPGDGRARSTASIRASASSSRPTRCFPWRNVHRQCRGRAAVPRRAKDARPMPRRATGSTRVGLAALREPLSAPAFRRHAQARGAGADLHQRARRSC